MVARMGILVCIAMKLAMLGASLTTYWRMQHVNRALVTVTWDAWRDITVRIVVEIAVRTVSRAMAQMYVHVIKQTDFVKTVARKGILVCIVMKLAVLAARLTTHR